MKYPRRENMRGVDVRRIPFSSFGKSSIAIRTLVGGLFVRSGNSQEHTVRGVDAVVVARRRSGSIGAVVIGMLHRAAVKYWVMDVNTGSARSAGHDASSAHCLFAFSWAQSSDLRRAKDVIVLDRFMADRIRGKLDVGDKLTVLHRGRRRFRSCH
jgi:hypothetical protein